MIKPKDHSVSNFFWVGGWVVILRIYSVNIVRIPSWKNTVQCNNLEERGANEHEIYPEYFGSWVYPCLKRQAANEVVMISFWDSSPHWKIKPKDFLRHRKSTINNFGVFYLTSNLENHKHLLGKQPTLKSNTKSPWYSSSTSWQFFWKNTVKLASFQSISG